MAGTISSTSSDCPCTMYRYKPFHMSQYHYPPSALGPGSIRLLRLMPNDNDSENPEKTEIQSEMFEYTLHDVGKRTHLYEALSYTWGGEEKPRHIIVNEQTLAVTENLHAALLRLRDRSLQRIIWIDAICINQTDLEERSQQVQIMAQIYSKAHRVLVWLGETASDVEGALEDIQLAANRNPERLKKGVDRKAIFSLIQRPWFQRIWVLQEVAAARHVVMMCGSTEIDGFAFCMGLNSITHYYRAFPEVPSLLSTTDLIERAGLRSKYTTNLPESSPLEIRSLAELVDMFHTREASNVRDKVYALLGMSSDDPGEAGIRPNYELPWRDLFKQLIVFILGKDVSVETFEHSQRAVIKSKGCVLGTVSHVWSDDKQNLQFISTNSAWLVSGGETKWAFRASAKSIEKDDIVCLLYGASKPTIIRLRNDHFTVIVIAATPLDDDERPIELNLHSSETQPSRDFLLVWNWEQLRKLQDQAEFGTWTKTNNQTLEDSKTKSRGYLEKATALWNAAMIFKDLQELEKADQILLEARSGYVTAFGKEDMPTLNCQYSGTPLSWAAENGLEDVVKLLLAAEGVDADSKDPKLGRTPLSQAAENGHEVVVKLLLASERVDANSKDSNNQTPLLQAAKKGHKDIVKLLLATKGVDTDSKDSESRTLLSWAAANGHEDIVKLLLATEGVDVDSKDKYSQTPLLWAAIYGRTEIVKLLLASNRVNADSKDYYNRTPLSYAAAYGHEDIVKLLLAIENVDATSKDSNGKTPLLWAQIKKHTAIIKLLQATTQDKQGLGRPGFDITQA